MALPLALTLGDFAFTIVIGCMGTRQAVDYADVFGDGPATVKRTGPRNGDPQEGGPDRFDDAIARALEAHKQREAASRVVPRPVAPPAFGRASGGFGRRVV